MALSTVVLDAGETLVDEAATYARREAERVRSGGHAHVEPPDGVASIRSLAELPTALGR